MKFIATNLETGKQSKTIEAFSQHEAAQIILRRWFTKSEDGAYPHQMGSSGEYVPMRYTSGGGRGFGSKFKIEAI